MENGVCCTANAKATDLQPAGSTVEAPESVAADVTDRPRDGGGGEGRGSVEDATCRFFLEGRCVFGARCRNLHPGQESATPAVDCSPSGKRGAEQKRELDRGGKKPPMKTAEDVIHRLQWDAGLPKGAFSVGYLDRFLGIIEKPFEAFSWEDLASVDHTVLAVPKHRIQYFKYKERVVWEKATRTDHVFGSTGGGMTILDIVDGYDTWVATQGQAELPPCAKEPEAAEATEAELVPEAAASSDDEEGGGGPGATLVKRRPNHFVAVRLSSEEFRTAVKEVQNHLLKKTPVLAECCVPPSSLHLTLCLLRLDSAPEFNAAFGVLGTMKAECQRLLPPAAILKFSGLHDFQGKVLYVAPDAAPELVRLAQTLDRLFSEQGLAVTRPPDYANLHVTVAKLPKGFSQEHPDVLLRSDLYRDCPVQDFGCQLVDSLSLCFAGKTRRSDGFFTTPLVVNLY
uniref:Leukocyte receptor cluster member 9 n=2 Tax=Latimeria chalumnae TaxID=7897 RepID=H3AYG4_LATCH